MWFRRRRRRPQLDLGALERLSDTIARAVALLEQRLAPAPSEAAPRRPVELVIRRAPDWRAEHEWEGHEWQKHEWEEPELGEPQQRPEPEPQSEPEAQPEPGPEPEPEPEVEPEPAPELPRGFVLFVPTQAGYRLVTAEGPTPERGERLSVEDEWYCVLRLGPSPLPDDERRCVFLEPHLATLE